MTSCPMIWIYSHIPGSIFTTVSLFNHVIYPSASESWPVGWSTITTLKWIIFRNTTAGLSKIVLFDGAQGHESSGSRFVVIADKLVIQGNIFVGQNFNWKNIFISSISTWWPRGNDSKTNLFWTAPGVRGVQHLTVPNMGLSGTGCSSHFPEHMSCNGQY